MDYYFIYTYIYSLSQLNKKMIFYNQWRSVTEGRSDNLRKNISIKQNLKETSKSGRNGKDTIVNPKYTRRLGPKYTNKFTPPWPE